MAKIAEGTRFNSIVAAARRAFIANRGFRRTQMSDVAQRARVAPGTLYLYLTSKEALFEAALLGIGDEEWWTRQKFPFEASPMPDLIETLRGRINAGVDDLTTLNGALASNQCGGGEELMHICGQLYDLFFRAREAVRLVEACAEDFPELAAMYFESGRVRIANMLIRYLELGQSQNKLGIIGIPTASARQIIETLSFWAIHRHWDQAPMNYAESNLREDAIAFAAAPFLRNKT